MRYFLLNFLFYSVTVTSQTISKQVIGSTGQTSSASNTIISYTVGEVVVGPMLSDDTLVQLGNGYYPSLDLSVLSTETEEINMQIKVFPNPVSEFLYISHPTEEIFTVQIIDINGKLVLDKKHNKNAPIPMQSFELGTYFIKVTSEQNNKTNTYKIIKK